MTSAMILYGAATMRPDEIKASGLSGLRPRRSTIMEPILKPAELAPMRATIDTALQSYNRWLQSPDGHIQDARFVILIDG